LSLLPRPFTHDNLQAWCFIIARGFSGVIFANM